MLEKFFLSWLTAITAEYLLLPGSCRKLDGLEGITRMSAGRAALIFLFVFSVLSFFSRKFTKCKGKNPYRWGILLSFTVLAIASLMASFIAAFFAACLLLFSRLLFDCVSRQISVGTKLPGPLPCRSEIPLENKKTDRISLRVTVILSVLFFLFVSLWTVSRVYCFSTSTYDFGIFSQMFHYMKTTGLPCTTLERDGLLSHFHVHMSPIYYLLLPFYCLAPVPATLQVLQAAVITSAVIPLWKLGRHYGLTPFQQMLLCALLLFYPAFSGGVGYDIHENCFLTPLLLWLFYGIARKNSRLTAVAALLTMLVKEDAPVYVACVGLWLLASSVSHNTGHFFPHPTAGFFLHNSDSCRSNPDNADGPYYSGNRYPHFNDIDGRRHSGNYRLQHEGIDGTHHNCWKIAAGSGLLFVSLAYFFAVSAYLATYGDGLMTARYGNFFSGNAAPFSSLLKTAFLCPMKVVYECADPDKLWFIAITILPLLGLPLITRRWERYLLLIPYILINLMPDYAYQHDIFFQYVFGSTACLLYLTIINLTDLQQTARHSKTAGTTAAASATTAAANVSSLATTALTAFFTTTAALTAAVVICAVCFATAIVPKAVSYPSRYIRSREHYQELHRVLSQIPDEASVTAATFYTTFLSQRDVLYDIRYASGEHLLSTEFVVLDPSSENDFAPYAGDGKTGCQGLIALLDQNGYRLYASINGTVEIYRHMDVYGSVPFHNLIPAPYTAI